MDGMWDQIKNTLGVMPGAGTLSGSQIGQMMGSGAPGDLQKAQDAMMYRQDPDNFELLKDATPEMRQYLLGQAGIVDTPIAGYDAPMPQAQGWQAAAQALGSDRQGIKGQFGGKGNALDNAPQVIRR